MEAAEASTLALVREWIAAGHRIAAATLVRTEGSAPLEPGATLWVDDRGAVEGTVTGGCVEAALVERARSALEGAAPATIAFGSSDRLGGDVGLTCGGRVHVHVAAVESHALDAVDAALERATRGRAAALATVAHGAGAGQAMAVFPDSVLGSLGGAVSLDTSVTTEARRAMALAEAGLLRYGLQDADTAEEPVVLLRVFAAAPQMVIVGASDHSAALAALAGQLGYEVTVCDPRAAFASSPRFSSLATVTTRWPQDVLDEHELGSRDAVVVLSHDPKLDEPALRFAVQAGAGYIGALGSRRTQRERMERLRSGGMAACETARISGPCGLDIGAATPGETAVAILAEIVATRAGRAGGRLVDSHGQIRRRRAAGERAELAAQV